MGARSTFFSLFKLGDKVAIDGDASIRATVIGFAFYPHVEQVVSINYPYRVIYIRFVGTHAEYDEIDAEEV